MEEIFWRNMAPEEMHHLRENGYFTRLKQGEVIFRKGERRMGVYLVISGSIDLLDHNGAGQELYVRTLLPGEVLGEMGTFGSCPCEFTARAKTPTDLFKLETNALASLAAHSPRTISQVFVNVIGIILKE